MIKNSLITLLFSLLLGAGIPGMADDAGSDGASSRKDNASLYIPKAQRRYSEAQGCVEPTEEMRKNHMEYILDQRDATMHQGIRTTQYSLVKCINCHVSDAPDAPRIDSEEHFCNSCHSYAGVSIDCFQCHADRPVKTRFNPLSKTGNHPEDSGATASGLASVYQQVLANEGVGNE
jgi:hypothetical protein